MQAGGQAAATPTGVGSRPAPGPSLVELASGVHAAIRSFRLIRREPCAFAHTLLTPRRGRAVPETTGVSARTAYEKISDDHALGSDLLFVDLHLVHEVTSAQAFEGLRLEGRTVRRADRTLATADHNVPTWELSRPIEDDIARQQLEALARNVEEFGIPYYGLGHRRQGIVHVIGPELGITQPGMTIVCGDSHTSTHGAFGALAFGIGTSEVEHVLATQTLPQKRAHTLRVTFTGEPGRGVAAKDLILGLIAQETAAGATNHVVEYDGEAIRALSMEGRMTVSNMSIEWGARAGLIAPDESPSATSRAGRACRSRSSGQSSAGRTT